MKLFLLFLMLVTASAAFTQTCISIKGNTTSGLFKQLHLDSQSPTTGQLWQPEIAAAAWTCGGSPCNTRAILRYELSSIPQNAVITSAVLYLYAKRNASNGDHVNPTYGTANRSVVFRVTSPWDNPGWENQPSVTAQDQRELPQSTSPAQNYYVDMGAFVQLWVNNPAENHGVLIRLANETPYNSMIFHSGTSPAEVQPTLEICYTTGSTGGTGGTSGNGFVGIGTTSPTAQLHTTGSVRFQGLTNDNTHNNFVVADASGKLFLRDILSLPANNAWLLTGNNATNPAQHFLGTTDNQRLAFRTNNAERMSVSGIGYVGIGTTNPTAKFHVNASQIGNQLNPSNIRFENLPAGAGNILVIDQNGYIYRSSTVSTSTAVTTATAEMTKKQTAMELEIILLKKEINELKNLIKKNTAEKQ